MLICPSFRLYVPGGHEVQASMLVAPLFGLYVPVGQSCTLLRIDPNGHQLPNGHSSDSQSSICDAPGRDEYRPSGALGQRCADSVVEPGEHQNPAVHRDVRHSCSVSNPLMSLTKPAGQGFSSSPSHQCPGEHFLAAHLAFSAMSCDDAKSNSSNVSSMAKRLTSERQ